MYTQSEHQQVRLFRLCLVLQHHGNQNPAERSRHHGNQNPAEKSHTRTFFPKWSGEKGAALPFRFATEFFSGDLKDSAIAFFSSSVLKSTAKMESPVSDKGEHAFRRLQIDKTLTGC